MRTPWLLALAFLVGCAPQLTQEKIQPREDPLVEKIYSTIDQRFLDKKELFGRLKRMQVIYLGERHDNDRHHEIQLEVLKHLIERGNKPIIAVELFTQEQTALIQRYFQMRGTAKDKDHDDKGQRETWLRKQMGWQDHQDEYWNNYFSIIEFARTHELTLIGTDLSRTLATRITSLPTEQLTAVERSFWKDSGFVQSDYETMMKAEFTEGHCGWSNEKLLTGLYRAWLARNDAMSDALVLTHDEDPSRPIVMLLGGGHTEHGMAVLERVAAKRPGIRQIDVGITEIHVEPSPLEDYTQAPKIGTTKFTPAHEYFWFTQRQSYENPCQKYEKMLKKHKPK